jgi:glycogen synthase
MTSHLTGNVARPRITVIICAYTSERWNDLVAAVESVQHQSLSADEIVIVIDHCPALLARARDRFVGPIIVENSGSQGLSNARNTGIAVATGDLLAFLDDDAVADGGWLQALCGAMDAPQVVVAGGYVVPAWLDHKPRWLPEEFYWVVGCTHRGVPTQIAEIRNPIGASMMIRREVFDTVGTFSSEMGRVGTLPVGCEETELCIRARQQMPNARIMFVPDAVVDHNVPAKRTTWRYFSARCYAEGISKAMMSRMVGSKDGLSAERAHVLKTLPYAVFRSLGDVFKGDVYGIARAFTIVAGLFITILGYLRGKTTPNRAAPVTPIATDGVAKPMRVLLVSARFFPYAGGTETHTYEVAKRFAAEGHEVTVLTTDRENNLPRTERLEAFTIKRVAAYPREKDFYFAPAIYSVIQSRQWDVIHIQGYHTFVAPLAMFAAWRAGIPYVVTFHSGGHSSSVRNMLRWLQRLLLKPLLTRATQLVGVSQFEADFFASHLGIKRERFVVIPNGAHLPQLSQPVSPEPYPLIVSSGRLERYKGHQHVLAAFAKVLQRRSDARLRIAGSGPYEFDLNEMADNLGVKDYVEIKPIPAANRQGMAELLSKSSLVVLFSEYEAHPVAVMEALSLKRPVLVADTSGLSELAQRGLVAAVPMGCGPDALAEAMLKQLDHPLIPVGIQLPTWEECAAQLLTVYQQVLRRVELRIKA